MAGNEVELTEANFQTEVLESDVPVLVDFWAPWCGPCLMMGPALEELADEYAGKAKICKLNVDDARDAASNYQISSIPAIMVFKGGTVVQSFVGVTAKDKLARALDDAL